MFRNIILVVFLNIFFKKYIKNYYFLHIYIEIIQKY